MRVKPPFWTRAERIQWGCALMSLLGEHDLTNLHLVISGYRSIEGSLQVAPFAQAARTARALLGDLGTRGAVQNAVSIYNAAQATRGPRRTDAAARTQPEQLQQPLELAEDLAGLEQLEQVDAANHPLQREQYEIQEFPDEGSSSGTTDANDQGRQTGAADQRGNARSYRIDSTTLAFTPLFPDLDPTISQAQAILRTGLARRATLIPLADTTRDLVAVLQRDTAVPIRLGGLSFPLPRQHDLAVRERPRATLHITRAELLTLARELDAEDRANGNSSLAWEAILAGMDLQATTPDGLQPSETLDLTQLKHLIGLPGAGKTTLIKLLCVALARRGLRIAVLFTSIETARQYLETLRRYPVTPLASAAAPEQTPDTETLRGRDNDLDDQKDEREPDHPGEEPEVAALLVGRSGATHRRHADQLAELIAAQGNGGFGYTRPGADLFATRCPLPAFAESLEARQWVETWPIGWAPCETLREADGTSARLCPAWERCGRVKNQRALVSAPIWLGHIISADTSVPAHTSVERLRYFELLAETFDLIIVDECDATQQVLDDRGAITVHITGNEQSLHNKLQQMRGLLAANRMPYTAGVLKYEYRAIEFERHTLEFIEEIRALTGSSHLQHLARRYTDRLLTAHYLLDEALRVAGVASQFGRKRLEAISDFWESAMYQAYYLRRAAGTATWRHSVQYAPNLGLEPEEANARWRHLNDALLRYLLAQDDTATKAEIITDITTELVALMGAASEVIEHVEAPVRLLVVISFVVASYQRLAVTAQPLALRGEVFGEEQSLFLANVSRELREVTPRSLVGSFSAVRFRRAPEGPGFEIDYLVMDLAPRLLLSRLHELGRANVLLASATSWLEPSSAFHVAKRPDYVVRRAATSQSGQSVQSAQTLPGATPAAPGNVGDVRLYMRPQLHPVTGAPLRFSGAGRDREENLQYMVTGLARSAFGGLSQLEMATRASLTPIQRRRRKAALIVNSYEQVRLVVERLNDVNSDLGKRTRGVLAETPPPSVDRTRYVLRGQVEELGHDEDVEVIVFPLAALGRGVNILFHTDDDDNGRGAVGVVYFLTRPHPAAGDLSLMTSLLARDTQEFDHQDFTSLALTDVRRRYDDSRAQTYKRVVNLLARPMSASRLDRATLNNFAANLLVPILQTIGRGMRMGMPVQVYFVDAAWAPRSVLGRPESDRSSLLVTMRAILHACLNHPSPDLRAVYQALYGPFRTAFDDIDGLVLPETASKAMEDVSAAEADAPLSDQTAPAASPRFPQPRQQPDQLRREDEWEEMEDLEDDLLDEADNRSGAGGVDEMSRDFDGFEPTLETTALDFDLPPNAFDLIGHNTSDHERQRSPHD
jgi:hypothetical protein